MATEQMSAPQAAACTAFVIAAAAAIAWGIENFPNTTLGTLGVLGVYSKFRQPYAKVAGNGK